MDSSAMEREREPNSNTEKSRTPTHTHTAINNGGCDGGGEAEVVVHISGGAEETSNERKAQPSSCPSPEINKFSSPSPNRPPKIPTSETVVRSRVARTSSMSKPKSRFVEPPVPYSSARGSDKENNKLHQLMQEGDTNSIHISSSFKQPVTPRTPRTPRTPLMSSPGGEEEEEEIIIKSDHVHRVIEKSRKRMRLFVIIEWSAMVLILGCLVASLIVHHLKHAMIWGLEIWKWSVLVFVIVCGRLVTDWFIHFLVFLIERNFLLKTKVLYFVYGLKNSVQVFIWLGLVLLSWALLINRGVKRSPKATKVLNYVTRALASFLIGAVIWLVKTLLMKLLAASFHVNKFFDRIQESVFHQYVLQTLSGPALMERPQSIGGSKSVAFMSTGGKGKGGKEPEKFDVDQFSKMKQDKVSAWTMRKLVDMIRTQGLSTISNTIDQIDTEREQREKEITSEWEAKTAAYFIFRNVATHNKYISEDDLLRFLSEDEVADVLPLFEGAVETRKIKKSTLRNWVVKVYLDRKSLAHSLNDTKTAVKQLNNIITAVVIVVIIIAWFLMMGFATVKVFLFISSQMLVVAFMFGNTVKTMFESIIFVFVMHPFDVGDRCVIDGVQMIVEEMNILTTIFLKYDNEKIYYPNSVLAIKPISNFYRSPDMGDCVEFSIDVSTPFDTITLLKSKIKAYIDGRSQYWKPNHTVVVKEIENLNKMKMALYITHTMNHQNFIEKMNRRTELVLEMKKIFEELHIEYHLLPQEVRLSYVGPAAAALMSNGH